MISVPLRRLIRLRREVRGHGTTPLGSLSSNGQVTLRTEQGGLGRQAPSEWTLTQYQIVRPDDIVVNPMWLIGGAVGRSDLHCAVSPAYRVYSCITGVSPHWLHHVLRSEPAVSMYRNLGRGDTTFDRSVNREDFESLAFGVPPIDKQRRIADFLDDQVQHLDDAARIATSTAELVDARLAATVAELTELTDRHVRLGRLVNVLPGYAFDSANYCTQDEGVRLLRGVNVGVGRLSWQDVAYWPVHDASRHLRFALRAGDLVLGMDRPWIGRGLRLSRVERHDLPALLLQRVCALRAEDSRDQAYVYWALQRDAFRADVEGDLTGLSVPHLSGGQIAAHAIPWPSAERRRSIAAELESASEEARASRQAAKHMSDLLQERKRALITACMTGEFDVSAASNRAGDAALAHLPSAQALLAE